MQNNIEKTKDLLEENLKKQAEIEIAIKDLTDRNLLCERYRALQRSLIDVKAEISMLKGILKIHNILEPKKTILTKLIPFPY